MDAAIAVVGGGLAGLTAARRVAEAGADVALYEARESVGGRVRSREVDGFTLDRGFQVLFTGYPAVRSELDLDALALRKYDPGAVVCRDGRRNVLADPVRDPRAGVETAFSREVTVGDKLRVVRFRRTLRRTDWADIFAGDDQPAKEYLVDRGFSRAFVERFAVPLFGGITLDRSLSTSARILRATFKAMSEGAVAVPAAAMGAIPTQLADRARAAGADIRTESTVTDVEADARGATLTVAGDEVAVDAVVVATDPPTARELTGVDAIPTDGVGSVTQHYRLPNGADLHSGKRILLNADGDEGPITVAPVSAVAPARAAGDDGLLAATFVDDAAQDADAAELAGRTRAALSAWFPERRFDGLAPLSTHRIPFAQFAQPPGIHETLPDTRDPDGQVYLAGDFTRWSSIQGALASGLDAARAVGDDLG